MKAAASLASSGATRARLSLVASKKKQTRKPRASDYTMGLQDLAVRMRVWAGHEHDERMGSLAAVLDAAFWLHHHTKDAKALGAIECALAAELIRLGVGVDSHRTARLRRGQKLGSARAALAEGLLRGIIDSLTRKPTPENVAGAFIAGLREHGPDSAWAAQWEAQVIAKIAAAMSDRSTGKLKGTDPEHLVRLGLKAAGKPITGLTESQIKNLFNYKNQQTTRG